MIAGGVGSLVSLSVDFLVSFLRGWSESGVGKIDTVFEMFIISLPIVIALVGLIVLIVLSILEFKNKNKNNN